MKSPQSSVPIVTVLITTIMSLTTKSGAKVAPLFYGTAWKKSSTAALVSLALKSKFRAIDTAGQPKHYDEQLVGEAVVSSNIPREDLFLQTKFTQSDGQDIRTIPYDATASLETQVRQSVQKSLQNLRTEYLDSVLLHSPARTLGDTISIINILAEYKSSGKIRYLGISNIYYLPTLRAICAAFPPATIQIVQNRFYSQTGYDVELRQYCKQSGITYQSFWTLTANPHVLQSRFVKEIASKRGMTVENVFYRFCTQEGITVLDGTRSEQHMLEDLEAVTNDKYTLTEEEMVVIQTLLNELNDLS
jgi:diketogulonate reductase-like aldo/keto reductase